MHWPIHHCSCIYVTLIVVMEEFLLPRTTIFSCQFFSDLLFDAIEYRICTYIWLFNRAIDYTNVRFELVPNVPLRRWFSVG